MLAWRNMLTLTRRVTAEDAKREVICIISATLLHQFALNVCMTMLMFRGPEIGAKQKYVVQSKNSLS